MKKNVRKLLVLVAIVITAMLCFAVSVSAATITSNMRGNCEPYTSIHCEFKDEISMGGNIYKDALLFRTGYTGTSDGHMADAKFNFNGQYKKMTFYAGYVSGVQSTGNLTITVDGIEKQKVLLSSSDLPKQFTVSLENVHQVTIRFDGNNGYDGMYYGIGGINLESEGNPKPLTITSNFINNCEPYSVTHSTYIKELSMGGNTYKDAYQMRTGYTGTSDGHTADLKFNFNGNYESMSFFVGYVSGIRSTGNLTIFIDGEEKAKTLLSSEDLPVKVDIPLKDVHQVIIKFDGNNGYDGMYYGIGGINLVSNGKVQGIKMLTESIKLSVDNITAYAKAAIIPCDAINQNIIWNSSDKNIATVNNKGLITAVSGGKTVITAKTSEGDFIATCSVTVDLPVMPNPVEKIKATQSTTAIRLDWDAVEGADKYCIYYKSSTAWMALNTLTNKSVIIKNLTSGTKYTFAIKVGKNINGKTIWSNNLTTITTATKTAKPAKVAAAQNTSAIKLAWTKVTGADGYRIYYKSGNTWKVCVNSTTATSHTFKNLKAGAKYIFAVQPYIKTSSGVVWGEYAEFMTATKPAVPASKVTSPSKGRISLAFGAVNGADGYQVWYKTGNGSYKLYKTYGKTGTINFSNLKSGTKYTFAVRAGIKTSGGNIYGGYKEVAVTVK